MKDVRRLVLRRLGIASMLVGLAALSACSVMNPVSAIRQAIKPAPSQTMGQPRGDNCRNPHGGRYLGVSVAHTALLGPTEQALGITSNILSVYYAMGQAINMDSIASLCAEGILPIIELDTDNMPVPQVTSGVYDKYLEGLALALGTSQIPVGMDFNHEFNGSWYAWGYKKVAPAQFVAAWQHIVAIFRRYDTSNVTWIWNPNVTLMSTTADLRPWFPGDAYVNWVGLDGYFYGPTQNYATVFDYTISQVRSITKDPMIIMETGANPVSGRPRAIANIFQSAAKTPGLLGLIYFDFDKNSVHNWYINNDPSARAAFKAGAAAYLKAAG